MEEYNHEAKKKLGTDLFDHPTVSLEAASICVGEFWRIGRKEAQYLFLQDCIRTKEVTDKVPNPKDTREWRLEKETHPRKGKGQPKGKGPKGKGKGRAQGKGQSARYGTLAASSCEQHD